MGRKSDARERILNSAFVLMYRRGYGQTSVQDIARHAGARVGSLYYFYPSKEVLAVECLKEYLRRIEQLMARASKAGPDPVAQLQKFFSLYCRFVGRVFADRHSGCFFGNTAVELGVALPEVQKTVTDGFEWLRRRLVQLLEQSQAAGRLRKDCDAEKVSWELLAYLQGANLLAKAYNDRRLLDRFGRSLADLLRPYSLPRKRAAGA